MNLLPFYILFCFLCFDTKYNILYLYLKYISLFLSFFTYISIDTCSESKLYNCPICWTINIWKIQLWSISRRAFFSYNDCSFTNGSCRWVKSYVEYLWRLLWVNFGKQQRNIIVHRIVYTYYVCTYDDHTSYIIFIFHKPCFPICLSLLSRSLSHSLTHLLSVCLSPSLFISSTQQTCFCWYLLVNNNIHIHTHTKKYIINFSTKKHNFHMWNLYLQNMVWHIYSIKTKSMF